MKSNLPPTLEKKLINRNTPLPNTERSQSSINSSHHDTTPHQRTLVVGQGIRIQGTLEDIETLIIEGVVETKIVKTKKIIIQKTGLLKGEVDSQDIEISGAIEGNIIAQGNLFVTATGRLIGHAQCRRLKVEDGGQITGQIAMIKSDKHIITPNSSNETEPYIDPKTSLSEELLKTSDVSKT